MFQNTSTLSQDLFKDCLGFARHLFLSPGLYCRLEVKLGENSFNFQILANFAEKGKVPVTTGETREEGTTLERGCLLLVNMEQVLLLLESF